MLYNTAASLLWLLYIFPCAFTWWPIIYYIVLQLALYNVYCSPSSVHPVCPAAPFRPSSSPGATVTTPCSSVHPSLNPRGVITWQCLPDFTWEGDWSGCTFPEGVGHAVAPLAYRVAAGVLAVINSIQAIVSEVSVKGACRIYKWWCIQCMHASTSCFWAQVQALLQSVSLETFGDIYVAYIGPGGDSAETLLVLMLQVDDFFSRSSFQELETTGSAENFTLASLLASPVWSGGPALRAYSKQSDSSIHDEAIADNLTPNQTSAL